MNGDKNPTISFRQSLFWDTDSKKIDVEKNARYIIERVLDFGNDEEIRWLFRHYRRALLQEVLNGSRSGLHKKSKALWSLVLQ
ncbi:MAG: hypothetical protein Q8O53_02705 [Candidatus Moranbacteria bacterium]|nr:hypothetical protein [Candidatus Moranbacteria bacterium]